MPERREHSRVDLRSAGYIAAAYAVVAAAWIVISDRVLEALFPGASLDQLIWLEIGKGLAFVIITAGLLWVLIFRRLRQVRRAEIERTTVEGRLATFADNLPGVAYIKDAEGRFVFMRGQMPQGMPSVESLIGQTSDALLDKETAERMAAHDREVIESGQLSQLVEPVRVPNGTVRHYLIHRFPLRGPRGVR